MLHLVLCQRRRLQQAGLRDSLQRHMLHVVLEHPRVIPHLGGRPAAVHVPERGDLWLEHPVECPVAGQLCPGRVSLFPLQASCPASRKTDILFFPFATAPAGTTTEAGPDTRTTRSTARALPPGAAPRSTTSSERLPGRLSARICLYIAPDKNGHDSGEVGRSSGGVRRR